MKIVAEFIVIKIFNIIKIFFTPVNYIYFIKVLITIIIKILISKIRFIFIISALRLLFILFIRS